MLPLTPSALPQISENVPLADKTTMRVGGFARWYAEPGTLDALIELLKHASRQQIPLFILGRGSNVIIPDEGFEGLVIRLNDPYWRNMELREPNSIWVMAGARLKELCGFACNHGLKGFEFLEGIPGSLGGALRMNAGAMGWSLFEHVQFVEYLDYSGTIYHMEASKLEVEYRSCNSLEDKIAIGALLVASEKSDPVYIRSTLESYCAQRKNSQPRGSSAGCMFKNPPGHFAGKLIDETGLKGTQVGSIQVSDVHANFMINHGDSSASNVIELVRVVRNAVYRKHNILLEPEAKLLGKSWNDIL